MWPSKKSRQLSFWFLKLVARWRQLWYWPPFSLPDIAPCSWSHRRMGCYAHHVGCCAITVCAAGGLPISDSENGSQYRSCPHLAASFSVISTAFELRGADLPFFSCAHKKTFLKKLDDAFLWHLGLFWSHFDKFRVRGHFLKKKRGTLRGELAAFSAGKRGGRPFFNWCGEQCFWNQLLLELYTIRGTKHGSCLSPSLEW
jgi:hypothetical protein